MTRKFYLSRRSLLGLTASASLIFGSTISSLAQKPQSRIAGEITSERVEMPKSQPPLAKFAEDKGSLAPQTRLGSMSLVFSRSAAQEADLQALIAAQQSPASPQYHAWLTPDQFATRFGMSDADIAKAEAWLEQQGFAVEAVSRSKNSITFSGTAAQAEAAFGVELHNYQTDGTTHFAPAGDISLPAALSPVVQAVTNLSNFRPHSHMRVQRPQVVPTAKFTSSQTGSYFLTPADIETIYDIKAAQSTGLNGAGQSIAIMGQSAIVLSDIENFQSAAGLPKKDPTLVLVPNSGSTAVFTGDESESDLDLEYSGAIAPGATIYFVYTGDNTNASVTDAIAYAVTNDIAPIISTSYGGCETEYSTTEYNAENSVLAQAAAQGQTVIAASGDDGSTDCYGVSGLTTAQQQALSVDFPASSQYVTGMGGTEFPAANVAAGSSYWAAASGSDVISSAQSYIPEQVWNDDSSTAGISAGGGGASVLTTTRPTWQTGVPNIPSGTTRLVPDISLDASPNNAGYLYCSSDFDGTGITGSCSNGFRDSSNTNLTVAGGTSFTVPIFAGMVAMINQATGSAGQGVVNPTLYALATNPTTYASAFHDITTGNNACTAGTAYCTTAAANPSLYAATTGYDEATGLGSLDFNNLLTAWKAAAAPGTSSLLATITTVTAASTAPASGAADVISIAVAPATGAGTPTGTVTVLVDGAPVSPAPVLSSGTASYSFSSTTDGSHVVRVTYSGDGTYAPSTNTVTINIGPNFSIAAAPATVSVAAGGTGTSTINVTPVNGYTGTVDWSLSGPTALSTTSSFCYAIGTGTNSTTTVTGTAPVPVTLTLYTSTSQCSGANLAASGSGAKRRLGTSTPQASRGKAPATPFSPGTGAGVALAGLLFCGLLGGRSRKLRLFLALGVISVATLSTFGCGSSSSTTTGGSTTTSNLAAGTYVLTLSGADSASSISSQPVNITLTVQ
ncbi:protease pro-enzyme activation domain-containing protein [Granulicella sp. L56]|uniref:protease pro-enzyme activation domain-containing protein n=2 Tax=Acidobacteriaceae TaxID=204434 RepID=UPI00131B2EAB|nr:protease pro-enzyme activation domain-containing protein [Granulicella sp. L56]